MNIRVLEELFQVCQDQSIGRTRISAYRDPALASRARQLHPTKKRSSAQNQESGRADSGFLDSDSNLNDSDEPCRAKTAQSRMVEADAAAPAALAAVRVPRVTSTSQSESSESLARHSPSPPSHLSASAAPESIVTR